MDELMVHLKSQPQINTIIREHGEAGEKMIHIFVGECIVNLLDFLNLKHSMNDRQIFETAELMIEQYPFYRVGDFTLFCKMVKSNQIGKIYDRIDGNMLLGFLKEYESIRNEQFEKQHLKTKQFDNSPIQWTDESLEKLRKSITMPEKIKHDPRQIDENMKKWMDEFDVLWNKQQKMLDGTCFKVVEINGVHFTIQDFLKYKNKS